MNLKDKLDSVFKEQHEFGGTEKAVNLISPVVSVHVITYQHVNYISQCLNSLLAQKTTFDFEIVIGEDGSTDGTREICTQFAEKYPEKIRLFLRDRTKTVISVEGGTSYLNGKLTSKSCRGKYIALCEGDDYWTDPLKLEKQVEQFKVHPEASLCFHKASMKWETPNKKDAIIGDYGDELKVIPVEDVIIGGANFCATNSILLKAAEVLRVVELGLSGSYYYQVLGAGKYGAIYIPDNMSVYRKMSVGSWSERSKSNYQYSYNHNLAFYKDLKKLYDFIEIAYKPFVRKIINERAVKILRSVNIDKSVRRDFYMKEKSNFLFSTRLKWLLNYYDLKK